MLYQKENYFLYFSIFTYIEYSFFLLPTSILHKPEGHNQDNAFFFDFSVTKNEKVNVGF